MYHRLETHEQRREVLLGNIATFLAHDERFVAAWLTGSLGRGNADALSDIDLTVVVADAFVDRLCFRTEMVTAEPPAARIQLLGRFGDIANVHENNFNAPEGGTFTSILYRPAGHIVDWILIPASTATRPPTAKPIFEHSPIPVAQPEPVAETELHSRVAERVAFFWMMTAITVKYLIRRDLPFVCWQLSELATHVLEVETLLAGRPLTYRRQTAHLPSESVTLEALRVALLELYRAMERQMRVAGEMGISLRPAPTESIDALLSLA